MNEELGF